MTMQQENTVDALIGRLKKGESITAEPSLPQQYAIQSGSRPSPYRFGIWTPTVDAIEKRFSYENARQSERTGRGVPIRWYKEWTAQDVAELRLYNSRAFDNLWNMTVAALTQAQTPEGKVAKDDAINALAELSRDGNYKSFARLVVDAKKIAEAQEERDRLRKPSSNTIEQENVLDSVRTTAMNAGIKMDPSTESLPPQLAAFIDRARNNRELTAA
jgi:hypothetical protein